MNIRYTSKTNAGLKVALVLLVVAVLSVPPRQALASVITAFGGASGPGLDSISFNDLGTPDLGNDDVSGPSSNWVSINQKAFNATDYIDLVFLVEEMGVPANEYLMTEGVFNGSSEDWIGYQLMLGTGTGADFVQSAIGDGLDFDSPAYNSPFDFAPFPTVSLNEDVINAVDGLFVIGAFHVFTFTVDVPNGITQFTIRQTPRENSVPVANTTWGNVKSLF